MESKKSPARYEIKNNQEPCAVCGKYVPIYKYGGDSQPLCYKCANRGCEQIVRKEPKIGRNEPCPCGSGKKYKKCCIKTILENEIQKNN